MCVAALARHVCRVHKLGRLSLRLLALGVHPMALRHRSQFQCSLKVLTLGLCGMAMRRRRHAVRRTVLWSLGVAIRGLKLQKEAIRKQKFTEAMAALRTSAQTRMKNLHWDILPSVDGEVVDCGRGSLWSLILGADSDGSLIMVIDSGG